MVAQQLPWSRQGKGTLPWRIYPTACQTWQLPAELVISSWGQTGVHHVFHQHSGCQPGCFPSFLLLQCPKPNDNKCWAVRLSGTPKELLALQLFRQGGARTPSQQCLLRKLFGDVPAALTFIPLRDPDCTLSWTAVHSLTLGGCFLATRLMLKIKELMQSKQKTSLLKP